MDTVILFLLTTLLSIEFSFSTVHHVCPQCLPTNASCSTLDMYAANPSKYFNTSDTEFVFFAGNHTLSKNVTFRNLSGITLKGKAPGELVFIACESRGLGFEFEHVLKLVLSNLTFSWCGRVSDVATIDYNASKLMRAALIFNHVTDLNISQVTVQHSEGFGVFLLALHGSVKITNCTFQCNVGSENHLGGNAALVLSGCEEYDNHSANILIDKTLFLNGRSMTFYLAAGLVVIFKCPNVAVLISNVTMTGNEANHTYKEDLQYINGGNLAVAYYNTSKNNTMNIRSSTFTSGSAFLGGGMFVRYFDCQQPCGNSFLVSDSRFISNRAYEDGGAVYLSLNQSLSVDDSTQESRLEFCNCSFHNNTVETKKDAGIGMSIVHVDAILRSDMPSYHAIKLRHCNFMYNTNTPVEDGGTSSGSAALYVLQHSGDVQIQDSVFDSNNVTALAAFRSKLLFSGNVTLYNNSGYEGGGIVLCEASYMILTPNTTLTISHNRAFFTGGGIFAESRCVQVRPLCFYQINGSPNKLNEILNNTRVSLINNTANFAGSQLFGGTADNCHIPGIEEDIFFDKLFHFTYPKHDTSYISSDPLNVCFCNRSMERDCNISHLRFNHSVYLGQKVAIPLVTIGQYNGTVPGEVEFQPTTSKKVFLHSSSAHTWKSCINVTISVFTDELDEVDIAVKVKNQHATYRLNLKPVSIKLRIRNRPMGFNFSWSSNGSYSCISKPNITDQGFKCLVRKNQSYIIRPKPKWIGYYRHSDHPHTMSGFITYHHCPLDFCVSQDVKIQTDNTTFSQDVQCAYNRSGILCGQCRSGYSIGMGPLRCIDCSHHSMAKTVGLSIAFLMAGLLMVIFLLLVDFTLTQGTMSELLFYANTFFIYKAALLPADTIESSTFASYKRVLEMFMNIVNLIYWHDFCFYNGLDLVGRTWLQFLLVVYLWLITSAIVWLCRKSAWLANQIGSKAVPVLATILLLSCSPLNLSILYSLTFASMEFPGAGSKVQLIMLFDGNVSYFKGRHIPLFIAGCIFAVLSLGFTLTLLCVQPLQRYSHLCLFRWVNKLKPLLDAYTCPHIIKPHCRFWNGFLLLVRMALYIFFIIEFDNVLLAISITCLLVLTVAWAAGGVYNNKYLNILSSSYILNIGLLSILTQYPANKSWCTSVTDTAGCVSNTLAFLSLLGTIAWHILSKLKQRNCFVRLNNLLPLPLRRVTCKVFPRSGYQILRDYAIQEEDILAE